MFALAFRPLEGIIEGMPTPGQRRAGELVRQARGELGISQADLAEQASVDPGTLSALETGKRWPRGQQRAKISRALGKPPSWLDDAAAGELANGTPVPSGPRKSAADPGQLMGWFAVRARHAGHSPDEIVQAADDIGLSRYTAERYAAEPGRHPLPDSDVVSRIAEFLGMSPADVLTGSGLLPAGPVTRIRAVAEAQANGG